MSDWRKVVKVIKCNVRFNLKCPYCETEITGFLCDPRGKTYKCENCGGQYTIDHGAEIEIINE